MRESCVRQCQCSLCVQDGNHPDKELHHNMNLLLSRLDEQQRRWYAAVESTNSATAVIGRSPSITGLTSIPSAGGGRNSPTRWKADPLDRVRLPGGGRPALEKKIPEVLPALLEAWSGPQTGGDPMGRTKFVRPSLETLSTELRATGLFGLPHDRGPAPADSSKLLAPDQRQAVHRAGPPRPGPAVPQHRRVGSPSSRRWGMPIISVDAKKKELIGNFKNAGASLVPGARGGQRLRLPQRCRVPGHPLRDLRPDSGRGHVCVGTSADTAGVRRRGDRGRWWHGTAASDTGGPMSC